MAWITKNSAGMSIDLRDEPYLDAALATKLEAEVVPRFPTRQAATLPVLHAIQDEHGWLPLQAIEEAAGFLQLSPAQVLDTATFYEEFWLQPKGRYVIWVCQSISCELMGHTGLLARLQKLLGIGPGETTEDGKFTLMSVECLGSCGTAPCALVNHTLHEKLTPDGLSSVLEALP